MIEIVRTRRVWLQASLLLLAAGYISVAVFLGVVLHYNFFYSDVTFYWKDSLAWQTPFHPFHVPGYALTIALARALTLGQIPAVPLMMGINLLAFAVCVYIIYQIALESGLQAAYAAFAASLFILWPFVGLVYSVRPIADIPASALFLVGLRSLLCSKRAPAGLLLGLAVITHKALWPFAGLVLLADLFDPRQVKAIRRFLPIGLAVLPLGLLWIFGWFYHGSPWWLLTSNLQVEMASRGAFPFLDGLVGTWFEEGVKGVLKGALLTGFALLAAALIILSARLKFPHARYAAAIAAGSFSLFLVLNQMEIWGAVRFSRLLVLPLIWLLASYRPSQYAKWFRPPVILAALLFLFGTQLFHAWYTVNVFLLGG